MKILCDVCGEHVASVYCCADEATLCDACDRRVHRANKLAGEHRRFSLTTPSAQTHPACDICQEKPGYLFCQKDRAILCKNCDDSVHSANHLTMKHNRFLLTGVRLSAVTPISGSPSPETQEIADRANNKLATPWANQNKVLIPEGSSFPIASTASVATASTSAATSSISEYLLKMCPGWCVEGLFVDDATAAMEDFAKREGQLLPLVEPDLDAGRLETAEFPIMASRVAQFPPGISTARGEAVLIHYQEGAKVGRERWCEDVLVPQNVTLVNAKRPRHSLFCTTGHFGSSL